jgi:hypothetical protein
MALLLPATRARVTDEFAAYVRAHETGSQQTTEALTHMVWSIRDTLEAHQGVIYDVRTVLNTLSHVPQVLAVLQDKHGELSDRLDLVTAEFMSLLGGGGSSSGGGGSSSGGGGSSSGGGGSSSGGGGFGGGGGGSSSGGFGGSLDI